MKECLKSKFRDKEKNVLSIFAILVTAILVISSFYALLFYKDALNRYIDKKEENRTLIIYNYGKQISDKELDTILEIEHIINKYEEYTNWNLKYKQYEIIPTNRKEIKTNVTKGRDLVSNDEILINKAASSNYKITIGDKIKLNDKYEVTVVGIVDENSAPKAYFNIEKLRELAVLENAFLYKINLIVDEYKNLESVKKELTKLGYDSEINDTLDQEVNEMKKAIDSIQSGVYIVLFFNLILTIFIFKYLIKLENKNNALLKILGFKIIKIVLINALHFLILCIIALLGEIILYIPIKLIFDIFNIFTLSYVEFIKITLLIIALHLCILLISTIVNFIKMRNIDMLNIIEEQ